MPATNESIVKSAETEWNYWGNSIWHLPKKYKKIGHRDDEDTFAQYVIDKYCSVGGGSPSPSDIQDDRYAWSAVGMSTIMKNAGFKKNEFPFAQSHSVYIRKFIAARISNDKTAAYWGYRLGEPGGAPAVGDLIGYARGKGITADKATKYFDKIVSYESHTDVVIAVRATEIDVIGANVLDSVTKKTLRINNAGHIEDSEHFWFVTLKQQQT